MPSPFDPELRSYAEDRVIHGSFPRHLQAVMRAKTVVKKALATGTPAPPVDKPYRVVAVLGQSNASGAGNEEPGVTPPPVHPQVHQWPGCGRHRGRRILLADDPLLHEVPGAGVGFATTFGSLLAESSGDPVLLVPCARGDTSFFPKNGYSWDPDNHDVRVNLYDFSLTQIDSALARTGQKLDCILWHQGESDGPLSEPAVFQRQFDRLIEGLRDRYGPVPFLLGQLSPEYMNYGPPKLAGIDAVHQDTPRRWSHVRFVPSPAGMLNGVPGSGLPEDPHFTAEAGRIIGRRMFEAYQDFSPSR